MNEMEFTQGINRLIPLIPNFDSEDSKDRISALFQAVRWIPGNRFNAVISDIVKNFDGRWPTPARFKKSYESVMEKWRFENRVIDEKKLGCPDCNKGYQEVFYLANGLPYQGIVPCRCNPIQISPSKCDLTFITKEKYTELKKNINPESHKNHLEWMKAEARQLSGRGAQWVISQIDQKKTQFPQEVMAIIAQRMGAENPKTPNPFLDNKILEELPF